MNKWFKITGIGLLIVFSLGGGCIRFGRITYSEGERTGIVSKFSRKGLFFKTHEGDLLQGGLEMGGVPQSWGFSADNPETIEKVQKAQRSGRRCTLHYKEQLLKQFWRGETKYFVIDVTEEKNE